MKSKAKTTNQETQHQGLDFLFRRCRNDFCNTFVENKDAMKISFIKTQKPRRFGIKTRYYDPMREDRELRRKKYTNEEKLNTEERLRARMARRWHRRDDQTRKQAVRKTLIYALIVFIIIYLLYFKNII